MKVKSYFAESVEAAVSLARLEMGPEAMLLSSKRTFPESRHLGEYEVVFANAAPELSAGRELSGGAGVPSPVVDRLVVEVADLKKQLERTASIFHRAGSFSTATISAGPELLRLFSSLVASGLEPEIAHNLVESARHSGNAAGRDLAVFVRSELQKLVLTDDADPAVEKKPRVMALVGPPGAGKTTTLVKLAVVRGLALHKQVHLISTDTYRIGGADQLRTFAAVLGIGFDIADGKAALSQTLETKRHCGLILIDTPGFDLSHQDLLAEAAETITSDSQIETHLVLPASGRAESLRKLTSAYELFRPAKVIFTKLDEADMYGVLISHALWSRLPISFLTNGQSIPEDLRPANAAEIAGLVLGGRPEAVAAAA